MSAGWQVITYAVALVAFVLAAVVAPPRGSRYYHTLIAVGLAALTLVSLWNANAIYE